MFHSVLVHFCVNASQEESKVWTGLCLIHFPVSGVMKAGVMQSFAPWQFSEKCVRAWDSWVSPLDLLCDLCLTGFVYGRTAPNYISSCTIVEWIEISALQPDVFELLYVRTTFESWCSVFRDSKSIFVSFCWILMFHSKMVYKIKWWMNNTLYEDYIALSEKTKTKMLLHLEPKIIWTLTTLH